MKHHHSNRRRRGFAAMPMVSVLGLMLILSLAMVYRNTLVRRDQAAKTQLRLDYHEREEALMRALVATFPKKVVACMRGNYASSQAYSWSAVFADAIARASVADTLSADVEAALGLSTARQVDVGDASTATVQSWITSLEGVAGRVTPGTAAYAGVFAAPQFAGKVPPLLDASSSIESADALRPMVTPEKYYPSQVTGLMADVDDYPIYNLIPYPNIRFGYASPGQPFEA